jgi:hypothetical protein
MPISTKLSVCHNRCINSNKVFLGKARRGKTSTRWFYGFKLFLVVNGIARFGAITILLFNGLLMTAGFIIVISFPFVFLASVGFSLIGLGSSIIVPIVYSPAGKSLRMSAGYACLNHYGWLYRLSIISINYRDLVRPVWNADCFWSSDYNVSLRFNISDRIDRKLVVG